MPRCSYCRKRRKGLHECECAGGADPTMEQLEKIERRQRKKLPKSWFSKSKPGKSDYANEAPDLGGGKILRVNGRVFIRF